MSGIKWPSGAKYGKTGSRKGGGKMDVPGRKGDRGLSSGGKMPGKAPMGAQKSSLDSPGRKGNKGVIATGMKRITAKAPRD